MGCNNSKSNVVGPKAYKNAEPASQAVVTAELTVAQPAPVPTPIPPATVPVVEVSEPAPVPTLIPPVTVPVVEVSDPAPVPTLKPSLTAPVVQVSDVGLSVPESVRPSSSCSHISQNGFKT